MDSYAVDATAWSLAGFIFGFCLGAVIRDIKESVKK
jgi:hypothetical protein